MIKTAAALCVLLLTLGAGCAPRTESKAEPVFENQLQGQPKASQSSHLQFQTETLGEVPNSGLQLPVVSPDGKWIAYLDLAGDQPLELGSLFSGRGLERMSLHIQAVGSDAGGPDG